MPQTTQLALPPWSLLPVSDQEDEHSRPSDFEFASFRISGMYHLYDFQSFEPVAAFCIQGIGLEG